MEFFTKWSFKNKAAVSLVTIFILLIGVVSYFKLPMEFLPSADNPQVTIVTMGQGTDSKTMETQVTDPIERVVTGVKGKSSVYSTTGDGFSKVDLFFESGSDMKQAKLDVQEALDNVTLPQNIAKPTVTQLNTSMIPISFIAVTFKEGLTAENLDFAKKELEPLYKDIKGVSDVQTFGVSQSVLSVKVDNKQLAKKKVSIQDVMSVLNGQNTALAVGEKVIDGKTSNIKVIGDLTSIEKLKALKVTSKVTLGEIAKVDEAKNGNLISRFNGKESIDISIIKDSQSNAVTISKEVEKVSKEINEKYPDQKSTIYLSTADMVETSVQTMVKEVLLGALFATIVIMVFLRNVRSTFITIVSIPLSLGFTLFLLSLSGVTLNILTLGGVAVAIGRLVDDSIVVIENIFRKMQQEKISIQLVMDATKEVGVAITASTLTTVAVFLPVALLNGGLQEFLLPFALTVTYSLLASLIVALTVVPLMSAGLLKKAKLPKHRPAKRFTKLVTWSLNHKWMVLIVALLLFVGSIGTYFAMPKGAIDNSSADYVSVTLTYPNDQPFDKVKEKAIELEETIQDMSEVDNVFMQLGNSAEAAQYGAVTSPTEATFGILVKDKANIDTILGEIEKQKENYPDAKLTATASSFMMGASKTNITIDVIGSNVEDLESTANKIKQNIQDIKGIEDVTTNQDEKKTIYSFKVDPAKGNTEQIGQQLGIMLNRTPIGNITLEDKQTPVVLEPILDPKKPKDLKNIPIMTDGGLVPVSKVASLKSEESATTQFHKDGETYLQLTATVDPAKLSDIASKINLEIFGDKENKGLAIPKDVDIYVGGASAQQTDDFTDLFLTMLISIGIVFLIMVITFKSIKAPVAILFSLPFAAIGAVLGLVISRIPVDITALLGALMLIGIVVTNAIVLLDRVKQNEQKMIIRDAIIEATATRFRPIIMTAVATICAMLPLLYKKAETGSLVSQSLAIVVIGGLAVSTLLTLIVIPCIYELLHYKKSKKQRKKKREPVNEHIEM
ncbi:MULTISPECIES: efflux RND transporter permease subunit [unclassified Peribacillus]|uniref:efflux RND transporter permease subunit n=1 Tax=unclassified Peribacillus TaxID=2675266 RepID=UPI00191126D7|nr:MULTISPECIES: efflux RND transporter permease subunit [unclassified Peribacillus]MBK5446149.1 efflux RND transporter permease subunit [Peribacillus sp. TH24]MBK5459179.1 efflux RND transporter permease subunit [Peribacillus sp. TH27]MBK5502546.1 efflux RND transporter permease subunit [Peribacillus sp. TH14]